MTRSVFISSTSKDLQTHRAAVDAALQWLALRPITMRKFGAKRGGAVGVGVRTMVATIMMLVMLAFVGLARAAPTIMPTSLEGVPFGENVVGVVLADFGNVDPTTRTIEEQIERAFEDAGVPFIRVRDPLNGRDKAQRIAELYNATITIYGESQADGIEVFYEITPRWSQVETGVDNVLSTVDLLTVSTFILEGVDALYVVDFVRGQIAYFEEEYAEALTFFESALARLPEDLVEEIGARSLYFYMGRSLQDNTTGLNPRPRLERAAGLYADVLALYDPEQPENQVAYAAIQNNLGVVHRDLARLTDPEGNLRLALAAYEEALRFHTPDSAPFDYATTQNNLGIAYRDLAWLTDAEGNLRFAIAAFEEALRFRTADSAPLDYANTQNNLGIVYRDLASLTDAEGNLRLAIAAYEEALRFRTADSAPLDYAATQRNLGDAYSDLVRLIYIENLPLADNMYRAPVAYREALRFFTPESAPLDYAATQNSLGYAYIVLSVDTSLSQTRTNLRLALTALEEALRFRTAADAPFDHAVTLYYIGLAYSKLGWASESREGFEDNFRLAVTALEEALPSFTAASAPLSYAETIYLMGVLQSIIGETTSACASFREALTIYQEAGITEKVDTMQEEVNSTCPDSNITPTPTARP